MRRSEVGEASSPVDAIDHSQAPARRPSARQANRSASPFALPFHEWAMYVLRFIRTDELCGGWSAFGGIDAHLNQLPIVVHLVTTESIPIALSYDFAIRSNLFELPRGRAEQASDPAVFSDILPTAHRSFNIQAARVKSPYPQPKKHPPAPAAPQSPAAEDCAAS